MEAIRTTSTATATPDFAGLASDLSAAWNAPGVTMRTRQRLLRVLVTGKQMLADFNTIHEMGIEVSQALAEKV